MHHQRELVGNLVDVLKQQAAIKDREICRLLSGLFESQMQRRMAFRSLASDAGRLFRTLQFSARTIRDGRLGSEDATERIDNTILAVFGGAKMQQFAVVAQWLRERDAFLAASALSSRSLGPGPSLYSLFQRLCLHLPVKTLQRLVRVFARQVKRFQRRKAPSAISINDAAVSSLVRPESHGLMLECLDRLTQEQEFVLRFRMQGMSKAAIGGLAGCSARRVSELLASAVTVLAELRVSQQGKGAA